MIPRSTIIACPRKEVCTPILHLHLHGAGILLGQAVPVTRTYAPVVRAAILANIRAVFHTPRLRIHGTVNPLWNVVLRKNVHVEEVARLIDAVGGMIPVIGRCRLALGRAYRRIFRLARIETGTLKLLAS